MLYQALRPEKLDEVFGNEGTVGALKAMLSRSSPERPHTFLLHGDSGCGKTTIARAFANELGCEEVDVTELNAANTRGIDTIRDIVSTCSIGPLMSPAKVIIFDESHQLTSAAQEALLKAIEDVPDYAYFFFCTTNPKGLIPTIRNRCAAFEVERLRPDKLMELVMLAAVVVEVVVSSDVLDKIVEQADGCPREALVALEKVLDLSDEEAVRVIASTSTTEKTVLELCRVIVGQGKERWLKALEIVGQLGSTDYEGMRKQILGYLRVCLLKAKNAGSADTFASQIQIMNKPMYNPAAMFASLIYEVCTV